MTTRSEDTMILGALTPGITDMNLVHEALKSFLYKKKELDYNDRFNGILFTEKGPQYLEDFTLNPDNLLMALKALAPKVSEKSNVAGGIFITATFVAEVFKRISGKTFRLIVLTDKGSLKIPEIQIPFIEDLLDKVKEIPFIMDVVRIDCDDPREDLVLMRLARRTGGEFYEIDQVKKKEEVQEITKLEEDRSLLGMLSKSKSAISKTFLREEKDREKEEEAKEICDLFDVFDELAKKKDNLIDEDGKMDINDRDVIFYESLAEVPKIKMERTDDDKCTICFRTVKNLDMVICPYCQSQAHKFCLSIWAKTSNIGLPHVFRCPNCYTLLRFEEEFIKKINSIQTPKIEIFDVEDLLLEEYLEKREEELELKVVTVQDTLGIPDEDEELEEDLKGEIEIKEEDELEIIWCPHCGKMTSNEFVNCPQCGKPLKPKEEKKAGVLEEFKEEDAEKAERLKQISKLEKEAESAFNKNDYSSTINKAERILQLAKNLENTALILKYQGLIDTCKKKQGKEEEPADLTMKVKYFRDKFKELIEEDKIIRAEALLDQFKEKYEASLNKSEIPEGREFLKEAEKFLDDRIKELEKEEDQIKAIKKRKDKEEVPDIEEFQEPKLEDIMKTDLSASDDELEKHLVALQNEIKMIKEAYNKSAQLAKNNEYDQGIELLEKTISSITRDELNKYKVELAEKKAEIKAAKITREKFNIELEETDKKLEQNREEGNLDAAIENCQKIFQLIELTGKEELRDKYEKIEAEIKIKKITQEDKLTKEREVISENKKIIEQIIEFEGINPNKPPLLEAILFSSIKEGIKIDSNDMLDVIEELLDKGRKQFKSELECNSLFISESKKIMEDKQVIPIENNNAILNITNPSDSPIKKLQVYSIIPYTYKLLGLEVDGAERDYKVEGPRKRGLVISMEFEGVTPDKEIQVKFKLEHCILRTLILVYGDHFKMVLMNGELEQKISDGINDVSLPLKILKKDGIEMIVIDDLIPANYKSYILEPEKEPDDISETQEGKLFGWILKEIENQKYLFQYRLFNPSRFEEIKTQIETSLKEGLNAVAKNNLLAALNKAKEICETHEKNIK